MSAEHGSHHHPRPTSPIEDRITALESLLVEKGIIDPEVLDEIVERYEHELGPMNGAKVVARAWTDPDYKRRLLSDGTAAIAELGFGGPEGDHLVVVENTPSVHNVIVCTLCSCYPWPVLGLPPRWYKSPPYRSRMVREPRTLLAEMGCEIADEHGDPRVGLVGRGPLPRASGTTGRGRGSDRGRARVDGDPRFDDRCPSPVTDTRSTALADPELPRSNGELDVRRAMAGAGAGDGDCCRRALRPRVGRLPRGISSRPIDDDPERPYWDSWAVALDAFVAEHVPDDPARNSGNPIVANSGEKRAP